MFALRYMKVKKLIKMKYQFMKHSVYKGLHHTMFKKKLLITNSLSAGGCMAIGDIIQQEFEYKSKLLSCRYDWLRLVRMCIVGLVIGPQHHIYYWYLDKFIPKANFKTALMKVACDQTIASPLTLVTFYSVVNFLERKTFQDCKNEIEKKFLYTYMADWCFWPPIQFINFYFLPTHYRVVYINVATIAFNTFLSYMKHYDEH